MGSIPRSGSPEEGVAPVFLPGESHGQRNPTGSVCRVAKSWTRLKQFSTHVPQYKIKSFLKNPNEIQNQSPFTKKFYL